MENSGEIILNQEQRKAVEYNKGPLLIVAGAGTGKTTVIAEKIRYLVQEKDVKPENILALTFTEKAAYEMEDKVDKNIPYGYFQMWISTFHSFADHILREEANQIGLPLGYKLLTRAESILFIRNNLFLFNLRYFRPLGNPNKFIEAIIQHFSRLRDEDVAPLDYLKWVEGKNKTKEFNQEEAAKYEELSQAYSLFQKLKLKEGYLDFSDLIFYLLKLFRQRKNVLKKYQEQFKYILIDEFQDTNIAQYALIKLLSPPEKNPFLTVVGDDSQAIYKFRGASVSNILTFMKNYPEAKQITLVKNYRSVQPILDSAYRLIKHNDPDTLEAKLGISKQLLATVKSSGISHLKQQSVSLFVADNVEEEADFVASQIIKLKKKKSCQFFEIAILVRANNHGEPFIRSLSRKGIPYQFLGPGMLYKQPEVKDLIAYLKVLYNLEDSVSMYRLLTMEIFDLNDKDVSLLLSFSKKINQPLFQAIEIYLSFFDKKLLNKNFEIYKQYLPFLTNKSQKQLFLIYKMINRHLKLIKKNTAGQILYYFLEDSKYLNKLVSYQTEKEEKIALNISKFFSGLKTYENDHKDASIFAVVDYLEMSMELGESPAASTSDLNTINAVNILTVHSAKGLEFPIVFIVNLAKGRFPTYHRKEVLPIPEELIKEILPEGDFHLEEERRLFYVALTRAMRRVYLTTSNFYGERKSKRKLSPFIVESLGQSLIDRYMDVERDVKKQLTIFDFKPPDEKQVERPVLKNNYFSYSQIATYNTCPLQYKYKYILKIPTVPTATASFGNTIHKTLLQYYKEFLSNNEVDLSRLLTIYEQSWIPIGYSSLAHQKRMISEGKKMLTNYYSKFHNKEIKIVNLEKLFKIKFPLSQSGSQKDIVLVGKIDRVDLINNNSIEIVDYKTGKKPDEKEIEKNLQLSIYAFASTSKGLYNKPLNQVKLSFYFLQDQQKISLTKTENDLRVTKQKIIKTVKEINKGLFEPKAGQWCDFCPFKIVCEAWQI